MAKLEGLVETGMVKYFFHSPSSTLPIRDVLGENTTLKSEPHIEIQAENFLNPCYQINIKRFALSDSKYLFFVTKCQNRSLPQYNKQYIVGYLEKEEVLKREKRLVVRGPTNFYTFDNSLLVRDVFPWQSFDRPKLSHNAYVDKEKTRIILNHFKGKTNILMDCIEEIRRLDVNNLTCIGDSCGYKESCLRYTT